MGKKKIVVEKVRLYYRGPKTKPPWTASNEQREVILDSFRDCIPRKNCAFQTNWQSKELALRFVVGLSQTLRCLKHKRTRAIIYDATATPHLTKYLNEFARQANVPIVQVERLVDFAREVKMQTLLVVSLVLPTTGEEYVYSHAGNPKPKPIMETIKSKSFDRLADLLQSQGETKFSKDTTLKTPELDKVKCTNKSQIKKLARKQMKREKATIKQSVG